MSTFLPIILKYGLPIISFIFTEGFKGLWERYGHNVPPLASVAIASAAGAVASQAAGDPSLTPQIGAILGMAAAAVHDIITPPGQTPKAPSV
jgi:hypothetical protein